MQSAMLEHSHSDSSQNPVRGFEQGPNPRERTIRLPLAVAVVQKNRLTTGALAGLDIAPAIPDHEARPEVDIPGLGGFEQQAWLRLAAIAARVIIVRTDTHIVELQEAAQP